MWTGRKSDPGRSEFRPDPSRSEARQREWLWRSCPPVRGRRNGFRLDDAQRFAELLEVKEEERLVVPVINFRNPNRAADGEAVVVSPVAGTWSTGFVLIGVQILIDEVLEPLPWNWLPPDFMVRL